MLNDKRLYFIFKIKQYNSKKFMLSERKIFKYIYTYLQNLNNYL